jgi:hypothetical protein
MAVYDINPYLIKEEFEKFEYIRKIKKFETTRGKQR